jgi:hypothetical protein
MLRCAPQIVELFRAALQDVSRKADRVSQKFVHLYPRYPEQPSNTVLSLLLTKVARHSHSLLGFKRARPLSVVLAHKLSTLELPCHFWWSVCYCATVIIVVARRGTENLAVHQH